METLDVHYVVRTWDKVNAREFTSEKEARDWVAKGDSYPTDIELIEVRTTLLERW